MLREFLDHPFGARGATAFNEHEVVRRSFFRQDFRGFICRSNGATFFQAGFLRRIFSEVRDTADLSALGEYGIPMKDLNNLVRPFWQSR